MPTDKIKPSDLRIRHQCGSCQRWITVHATIWGEPHALLKVGFCGHCQSSYFGIDGMGENAAPAVLQLVSHLLKQFPGVTAPSVH